LAGPWTTRATTPSKWVTAGSWRSLRAKGADAWATELAGQGLWVSSAQPALVRHATPCLLAPLETCRVGGMLLATILRVNGLSARPFGATRSGRRGGVVGAPGVAPVF
jgi:hypothetical protein